MLVAVGIFYSNNGTALVDHQYYLSNDGQKGPDGKTLFMIGSVTKVMTTALLAEQAANGNIDLHAPAQDYLPNPNGSIPGPVLPTTSWGSPVTITLDQLGSHQSGLARDLPVQSSTNSTPYRYGFELVEDEKDDKKDLQGEEDGKPPAVDGKPKMKKEENCEHEGLKKTLLHSQNKLGVRWKETKKDEGVGT